MIASVLAAAIVMAQFSQTATGGLRITSPTRRACRLSAAWTCATWRTG